MTIPLTFEAAKALTSEEFTEVIRRNASMDHRGAGDVGAELRVKLWNVLTSPELIARTVQELNYTIRDIDDQLASSRTRMEALRHNCLKEGRVGKSRWFEAKRENDSWRSRTLYFKGVISRRHQWVKSIKYARSPKEATSRPDSVETRHNLHALFMLAQAIIRHRETFEKEEYLPEVSELELWDALERIKVRLGEEENVKLSDWVDSVTSEPGFKPEEDL